MVVLIGLCLAGAFACAAGVRNVDSRGVERAIVGRMDGRFAPDSISGARCPKGVRFSTGTHFECVLDVEGVRVPVRVEVTNAKGRITFAPIHGVVVTRAVENDLIRRMHDVYDEPNDKADVKVSCPGARIRLLDVGAHFDCTVQAGDGRFTERVTVSDRAGNVTYRALQ